MHTKLMKATILLVALLTVTTACGSPSTPSISAENDSNPLVEEENDIILEEIEIAVEIFDPESENQRIKIESNIPLNKETVTSENIYFNEDFIQSNIFLSDDNKTVLIKFQETIENGDYTLVLSKSLQSQGGSTLGEDYMYDFSVNLEELINGYGELYYEDGSLMFRGELIDSLPNGHGILFEEDGTRLIGTFKDGALETCTRYKEDLDNFAQENQITTNSTLDIFHQYYSGRILQLEGGFPPDPCVIIYLKDGELPIYEGDYSMDESAAIGIVFNNLGERIYFGETKDLLPHGYGNEYINEEGYAITLYRGHFEDGMYNGKGHFLVPESYNSYIDDYYGDWKDNMAHGQGTLAYKTNFEDDFGTFIDDIFTDGQANGFIVTREQLHVPESIIHAANVSTDTNSTINKKAVIKIALQLLPQTKAIRTIKKVVKVGEILAEVQ